MSAVSSEIRPATPSAVSVGPGHLGRVARLVDRAPQVGAGDVAAGQALGHRDQHRAAAAAEIEHPLVAAQGEIVEDVAAHDRELPARRWCAGRARRSPAK